jgi:hypothetical protein
VSSPKLVAKAAHLGKAHFIVWDGTGVRLPAAREKVKISQTGCWGHGRYGWAGFESVDVERHPLLPFSWHWPFFPTKDGVGRSVGSGSPNLCDQHRLKSMQAQRLLLFYRSPVQNG